MVNQFSTKPRRSSEATEQPETENIHEFNVSLDRTLYGNGFEAAHTEVECHANESTDKGRLYNYIANISRLGNAESQGEPQLTTKSPMTSHKFIIDLDTHEAVIGHEFVADEKPTSSARSPCSNHAPPASAGKNSKRKNRIDPKVLRLSIISFPEMYISEQQSIAGVFRNPKYYKT
ncbi:unnamed protein product [Cylicostephanus goldi]|uniref:Uncharacterized protein n=1 Tax=Cylicostephanus goldi TaxID=71465 RepID=A0A3P7M7X8_CYLGO|nr:unnamed protein product [Cylicostephanus goldi]